LKAYCERQ